MNSARADRPILALDTGSPLVSVAIVRDSEVAMRSVVIRRSSESLLLLVDEVLEEAGVALADLGGVVALRGPGSFTGLRVGMASTYGLSLGAKLPVTALSTLRALASWFFEQHSAEECLAVVDALRNEWFTQPFARSEDSWHRASTEPTRIHSARVLELAESTPVVGFAVGGLAASVDGTVDGTMVEAEALAPTAARLGRHPRLPWKPELLLDPQYLRAPAIGPARPRGGQ